MTIFHSLTFVAGIVTYLFFVIMNDKSFEILGRCSQKFALKTAHNSTLVRRLSILLSYLYSPILTITISMYSLAILMKYFLKENKVLGGLITTFIR